MAKQALLSVLQSTIGKYVKNLDPESLNVAIWSGHIELQNLELDLDAVNAELDLQAAESPNLAIPFRVFAGSFGNLQVTVPWTQLTSQSVVLKLKRLDLVVEPYDRRAESIYTEENEKKRIEKTDRLRLDSVRKHNEHRLQANELYKLAEEFGIDDQSGGKMEKKGFVRNLIVRIIENIQIEIENVHVGLKNEKGEAGVLLKSLSIFTTDATGKPIYMDRAKGNKEKTRKKKDDESFLYKALKIDGFGIYLDGNQDSQTEETSNDHNYLLTPLSLDASLRQSDAIKCVDHPKYLLQSKLETVSMNLSKSQLELSNELANTLLLSSDPAKPLFPQYRPLQRLQKGTVKLWWQYAFRCVSRLAGSRAWREFLDAFRKRNQYVPLYKRHAHHTTCSWLSKLTKEEEEQLNQLETDRTISVEGIMFWRNLADGQVELERSKYEQTERLKGKAKKGGWFWQKKSLEEDHQTPIALSREEKLELENLSINQMLNAEVSKDSQLASAHLHFGGLHIKLSTSSGQLVSMQTGSASINCLANADGSIKFSYTISTFSIMDYCTPKTLFPAICSHDNIGEETMHFSFEKSKSGDRTVKLSLRRLEFVASQSLVLGLTKFFTIFKPVIGGEDSPLDAQEVYDGMRQERRERVASYVTEAWRQKVTEKNKWILNCNVVAPVIVLPEDCSKPAGNLVVVDLGSLHVHYAIGEPAQSVKDWFGNQLDSGSILMDPAQLSLSGIAVRLSTTDDYCQKKQADSAILEPMSIAVDAGIENVIVASRNTRVCVFGSLPAIKVPVDASDIRRVTTVAAAWTALKDQLDTQKASSLKPTSDLKWEQVAYRKEGNHQRGSILRLPSLKRAHSELFTSKRNGKTNSKAFHASVKRKVRDSLEEIEPSKLNDIKMMFKLEELLVAVSTGEKVDDDSKLCSFVMKEMRLNWQGTRKEKEPQLSLLSWTIKDARLNDHTPETAFPLIFGCETDTQFLNVMIRVCESTEPNVVHLSSFNCNIATNKNNERQGVMLQTSEKFVWKLLDFVHNMKAVKEAEQAEDEEESDKAKQQEPEDSSFESAYYIDYLRISPFDLVISFKRDPDAKRYAKMMTSPYAKLFKNFVSKLKFSLDHAKLKFKAKEVAGFKGTSSELINGLVGVYVHGLQTKVLTILSSTSLDEWKNLAARDDGEDQFQEGDILRATGNIAGSATSGVAKMIGGRLGSGVSGLADGVGYTFEKAAGKVGAKGLGVGVHRVISGVGDGARDTLVAAGQGTGQALQGTGKGAGQLAGGATGAVLYTTKALGKTVRGDGKGALTGLQDAAKSIGNGVDKGVSTAVTGVADGIVGIGQGIFGGIKSTGKGITSAFKGNTKNNDEGESSDEKK